jgi:serine/threonine-protein kinase HipA
MISSCLPFSPEAKRMISWGLEVRLGGNRFQPLGLGKTGWRLAPAFDVNPNIDRAEHVLNIDDSDNRPSLETVLNTAAFHGLTDDQARHILQEVAVAVGGWEDVARKAHITAADLELTKVAFSALAEFREPARRK